MEVDRKAFGERVLKRRKELHIKTQAQLGEKCGWIGESKNRISLYEKGERIPGGADLCVLANALEVSAEWLIFGRESIYANKKGGIPIIPMQDVLNFIKTNEPQGVFLENFLNELGGEPFKSFYLLAEGHEMVRDQEGITSYSIHDGDLLLVRRDLKGRSGDFVLVQQGNLGCRILQYISNGVFGCFRSFNSHFKPIYENNDNKIIGVITLIISPLKSKLEELAQAKVID